MACFARLGRQGNRMNGLSLPFKGKVAKATFAIGRDGARTAV
jgi:hypothetical protein